MRTLAPQQHGPRQRVGTLAGRAGRGVRGAAALERPREPDDEHREQGGRGAQALPRLARAPSKKMRERGDAQLAVKTLSITVAPQGVRMRHMPGRGERGVWVREERGTYSRC